MFYLMMMLTLACSANPKGDAHPMGHDHHEMTVDEAKSDAPVYACPMHSEMTSSHPGKCKTCGMTLVKQAPAEVNGEVYACPMHSDVTASEAGACPKCGMTLVKTEPKK